MNKKIILLIIMAIIICTIIIFVLAQEPSTPTALIVKGNGTLMVKGDAVLRVT